MKLIKNEIVSMNWDAEGFVESKKDGFIAAINVYGEGDSTVPVLFYEGDAYIMLDEDEELYDRKRIISALAEARKEDEEFSLYFEEDLVAPTEEILEGFNVADAKQAIRDIEDRLDDLGGYWTETIQEM